jgi:NADH-quinone oxidoreductase subunit J
VLDTIVFVISAGMVLGGALGVVLRSHPVHAALSMVLALFGVAVMFVSQEAHFLAAVQVIVYAGAIVVLFLFVIMLLGVDSADNLRIEPFKVQRPLAAIAGLGISGLVAAAVIEARDSLRVRGDGLAIGDQTGDGDSNIRQLAENLFSEHVVAFEVTSVLLVVAVVGTVLLARRPGKTGAVRQADEPIEEPVKP